MFDNFHVQFAIRTIGISLSAFACAFLWYSSNHALAIIFGISALFFTYSLIKYVHLTNRKITYFFDAIRNEDFTLHFPEKDIITSFKHLNHSLNRVNGLIQEVHLKKQEQEQFYLEILKHADIGILSINPKGHIVFANSKVEELLNYSPLNHVKQLKQIDTNLFEIFEDIQPFDRKLVELSNERENRQLSLKATSLSLNEQQLLLVAVQDIYEELDEKETDSWVKLIRVLTHEIMNSITPITSISGSILSYFNTNDSLAKADEISEDQIANTAKGLKIIKEQGEQLMTFVQSYRSFLNVPKPDRTLVPLNTLFEKIKVMTQLDPKEQLAFHTVIEPSDLSLYIDENQMTHVLVNLCKNAVQAMAGQADAQLTLKAGILHNGKQFIAVKDNGPGIPEDLLDQIFIPFFTTKNKGTGVGLSLSKQILHLHGANIKVHSVLGEETVFLMTF